MRLLVTIGIILFFNACDYHHEEEFFITNELDEPVTVYYQFHVNHNSVVVNENETEMMTSFGGMFGTVGVSDNRYEDPIDSLYAKAMDTTIQLFDSQWEYEQVTKYHGTYTITVDSTLFD